MSACSFAGTPDLYGVGIRTGFYLLWFGLVLAAWLAPRQVAVLRHLLLLYSLAVFLAAVVAASRWSSSTSSGNSTTTLRPVEIYLGLLLAAGAYYAALPLYLWRLVTGCSPYWDPARWPRAPPATRLGRVLDGLLLLAVCCFQMWFWVEGVHNKSSSAAADSSSCAYGFFLARAHLQNDLFVAGNIIVTLLLLLGCATRTALAVRLVRPPRWLRKKTRRAAKRGISDARRAGLALLLGVFRATTAGVVVLAVELTIQWNGITGVSDAGTAAQLVPLLVAAGMVAHVLWVAAVEGGGGGEEEEGEGSGGGSSSDSGERGGRRASHQRKTSTAARRA